MLSSMVGAISVIIDVPATRSMHCLAHRSLSAQVTSEKKKQMSVIFRPNSRAENGCVNFMGG